MNIDYKFSVKRKIHSQYEIMNIRFITSRGGKELKFIWYLNTIINYHLWKVRNDCVHNAEIFNYEKIVNKVIRSVGARKKLQQKFNFSQEPLKIPKIDELFSSIIALKNITFLYDNG